MNEILARFCPRIEFESYEDFFEHYRCDVPENFNFAYDVVDEWARLSPEKKALVWTNDAGDMQTFTFGDMKQLSGKAANVLVGLGVQKGDVVMLILKQRPEVWVMMIALEKIGAVCIPGTFQLTKKDIVYRCNIAEVNCLIAVDDDEQLLANIRAALPECLLLKHVALVGDAAVSAWVKAGAGSRAGSKAGADSQTGTQAGARPAGSAVFVPNACGSVGLSGSSGLPDFTDMRAAIDKADASFARPAGEKGTRLDEPMLIYFSSGTTGMPKMVLHNHTLPLGHIVTAKYWQCVEDNKIHLTQTDSGWAKFAWGKIYGQWICGAVIGAYDTEKFTPEGMLSALMRIRPVTFCAPATIFRYLIKEDLSGYDFSFIKHTSVAGEPLSPEVFLQIKEKTGLEIREGFGQSEGSVLAAAFKWIPIRPGSMGKPSPLFGLNLLGEDGEAADDGIVGNISITQAGDNLYENGAAPAGGKIDTIGRGTVPGLFRGYWKDEAVSRTCWSGGVYQTGDMAWHDADGYYWFVGRNDDVIKCSGYRIGPFEVESALMEHPGVLECAVTAAPDPIRGQVVKATVVLARGFSGTDELRHELQNHVKRVTAPYKYPRIIDFVDELPKTISGKIQRNMIRKKDEGTTG